MATVMTAVADDGVSVVLSSHVLAELERVADYLVLLSRGNVQVVGEVDDLLSSRCVLTGPATEAGRYARHWNVVHASRGTSQAHLLVRLDDTSGPVRSGWPVPRGWPVPPGWEAHSVTLEGADPRCTCGSRAPRRYPGPAPGRDREPAQVAR